MSDAGPGGYGDFGMRPPSHNPPRIPTPSFDIRTLIPLPIRIGWDWLMSVSGTDQKPNGVPDNWTEEPGKKDGHTKWVNPNNPHDYVRRKPNGEVTQVRDGKAYDSNGNCVDPRSGAAYGIQGNDFVFKP